MKSPPQLQCQDLEIVLTEDGSTALKNKLTGLYYRSQSGALTESRVIFIHGTKLHQIADSWTIVELGFGGARNFMTTLAERKGRSVRYHAIDHRPIPAEMIQGDCIGAKLARKALLECRKTMSSCTVYEKDICLTLHPTCWSRVNLGTIEADAFFFDPFSPADNPEAWKTDCFRWALKHSKDTAVLATYSAQGQMRRNMRDAGYFVARGPGCGAKRESTLACKTKAPLQTHAIKYKP